jgi:hypothetical protein
MNIIFGTIAVVPALWLSGRFLAGKYKLNLQMSFG